MSIKLQHQEIYQKKLGKLIRMGQELSSQVLKRDYSSNLESFYDHEDHPDIEDYIQANQYDDLTYQIVKWQKQCQHLLDKIPLNDTNYASFLPLLEERDLKGIDIQEIVLNLEAVLEDLTDGIFENLFVEIEAQSVINHLEQAYQLFDEGQLALAGSIGFCSLESFLREISIELIELAKGDRDQSTDGELEEAARSLAKDKKEKPPQGLIQLANFLKTKGRLSKEAAKTVTGWGEIRNKLVHGDSEAIAASDVKNWLASIKVFVVSIISS